MVEAKSISSITLIKKNINDFNDAIESIINILDEHSRRLAKIDNDGDARLLRKETFKCSNTMKKLDILLKDLQNFEASVSWITLPEAGNFYNEIQMLKLRISHSKESFTNLVDRMVILSTTKHNLNTESQQTSYSTPFQLNDQQQQQQQQLMLEHDLIEDINNQKRICDSYLQLQKDIRDLDETMKTFASIVAEQDDTINNIEANIDTALISINQGTRDLSKAAKLKRAFVPVTSAVVVGCVGGPVGAIMGLKVGIATAIGGLLLGYGGGKMIQKVSSNIINEGDASINECQPNITKVKNKIDSQIESEKRKTK